MIKKFLDKFGFKIDSVKYGKKHYLVDDSLDVDLIPKSIGVFLGEESKEFKPSLALLELIAKKSDRKIFIDDKAEWLFLCGRDLFGKSIKKANVSEGLLLVQNLRDENLGLGKVVNNLKIKDKVVVKNVIDRGDFLRRERRYSFLT